MARPDPWRLVDPLAGDLAAAASLLTVGNGWVGVRGALDEQVPPVHAATLVSPVHEEVALEHAEPAYGYPSTQQQALPVPDGWSVRLEVDGAPLDVRTGTVHAHERALDLRTAALTRALRWTAPGGATVEVTSTRRASLVRRELVMVRYAVRVVEPATRSAEGDGTDGTDGTDGMTEVRLRLLPCCDRSPLRAGSGDPRDPDRHVADDGSASRTAAVCRHEGSRAWTAQVVPSSGVGLAVVVDVGVAGAEVVGGDHSTDVHARLAPGDGVDLDLLVAVTAGQDVPGDELVRRGAAVLDDARAAGTATLEREHQAVLDACSWADVEVDGDDDLQQAVRFAMLQVVQSSALVSGTGVRAKGLTGTGYHGHTFWDADTYVLPLLQHVLPAAAEAHLRWRHSTLPWALEHARTLGLDGAAFAWRTVTGPESSGYWPASTAALHLDADVADAAVRHVAVTGDRAFEREVAVDLVVQTARLWAAVGHHADDGFHIHGVTGPDEYSALVDDNAFTNLMARRNLRAAVELAGRYPDEAERLGVRPDEVQAWTRAADSMVVPYDDALGVTQQHAGFTRHGAWDFTRTRPQEYPLEKHHTYGELYRRRVVKQADVVLAHWLAGEATSVEQKRRDLAYYEPLTVRDSSLSAPAQAVLAAEVGYLSTAHDLLREAALLDLHDLDGSVEDGLHVAALAGTWSGVVAGFGGLRSGDGTLRLAPRLPESLTAVRFGIRHGGERIRVEVEGEKASYHLLDDGPVELLHHGEHVRLTAEQPTAVRAVPGAPELPDPPTPPPGRPLRRPAARHP